MSLTLLGVSSPLALAFSGYGAGTSSNPYQIGSCAQLQEINNNLSADYVLIRDINCAGAAINSIGEFTGSFNGNDHTITNFTNASNGLFSESGSGAVFENLSLTNGTINATGVNGSLVGELLGPTTISNVHSSLTINSNSYTGGLVGLATAEMTMTQSSFTGSISSGNAYEGGLAGSVTGSGSSITDSYVAGTVNMAGDDYNGGVVGSVNNGVTLTNVYSAANINMAGGYGTGGIVGLFHSSSIVNSFAANTITGSGTYNGAVIGYNNSSTATNDYYDSTLASGLACSGDGSISCNAEDVASAAPNYFMNNTANGPLNDWNFSSIWQTNSSGYPTLRNLAGFAVQNAPNNGDANGDGILDNYQPNVASIEAKAGVWYTITVPSSSGCSVQNDSYSASDQPITMNGKTYSWAFGGYLNFSLYCPTAGMSVPVTVIINHDDNTSNWTLADYNTASGVYAPITGASFGTTVVGGVTESTITYSVTDGGVYDSDGSSNGVIDDPIGPVVAPTPAAPNTGFGATDSGLNLAMILLAVSLLCSLTGLKLYLKKLYF